MWHCSPTCSHLYINTLYHSPYFNFVSVSSHSSIVHLLCARTPFRLETESQVVENPRRRVRSHPVDPFSLSHSKRPTDTTTSLPQHKGLSPLKETGLTMPIQLCSQRTLPVATLQPTAPTAILVTATRHNVTKTSSHTWHQPLVPSISYLPTQHATARPVQTVLLVYTPLLRVPSHHFPVTIATLLFSPQLPNLLLPP